MCVAATVCETVQKAGFAGGGASGADDRSAAAAAEERHFVWSFGWFVRSKVFKICVKVWDLVGFDGEGKDLR